MMITAEELGLIKNHIRLAKKPREQLQIEAELHDISGMELQNMIYESAQKKYSPEFKEKVLQACKYEKAAIVAVRYGIKPQTIYDWRKVENDKAKAAEPVAPERNEENIEKGTGVTEPMPEEITITSETQQTGPDPQQDKLTAIDEIDLLFGTILSLCHKGLISKDFLPTENEAFLLGVRAGLEYKERGREG